MLLSPGDCCGGRFVYVVWLLLKGWEIRCQFIILARKDELTPDFN